MTEAEFERAVLDHRPYLVRVARCIVGSSDAEDVVQEALIRLWKHAGRFEPREGLEVDVAVKAWMVKAVVRRGIDWLLPTHLRAEAERLYGYTPGSSASPSPDMVLDAVLDLLKAFEGLSQQERELVASLYGGETGYTLAREFSSERAAYRRIEKVLGKLRPLLEEYREAA